MIEAVVLLSRYPSLPLLILVRRVDLDGIAHALVDHLLGLLSEVPHPCFLAVSGPSCGRHLLPVGTIPVMGRSRGRDPTRRLRFLLLPLLGDLHLSHQLLVLLDELACVYRAFVADEVGVVSEVGEVLLLLTSVELALHFIVSLGHGADTDRGRRRRSTVIDGSILSIHR